MPFITKRTVVVITGASSGIGRATARAFARRGASVVLAARRKEALDEVAQECRALGVRALAVPTDVSVEAEIDQLASRAIEEFGYFDVWVNNAGMGMNARVVDAPTDAFKKVIDTNLMGTVYGSRAALRHFVARKSGVLVQVSSVLGIMPAPFVGAYVASKFATVGLSSVLRQETLNLPSVHVCTVLPGSIDTPIYKQSANYSGLPVRAMPPVISVDRVARAIVGTVIFPRREVVVGYVAWLGTVYARLYPGLTELVGGIGGQLMLALANRERRHNGNVFQPQPGQPEEQGGWRRLVSSVRNASADGSRGPRRNPASA